MTAKQYMNQVRRIDKEIDTLLRVIEKTRTALTHITQTYGSDGAQSTKNPHKFDRLLELETTVDEKIDEQIALKTEILNTVSKLPDRRHRLVLEEYYLEMKTWEQVAVDLNYSFPHTVRLHGYALNEIQKLINNDKQ